MKASTQAESQNYYLNWELQKAATKLLTEIMKVKAGETVLITCDSTNDERVINATASAALTLGAYPIIVRYQASLDNPMLIEPTKPVLEAIKAADVWIEYDYQLFYTQGWEEAMKAGTRQITAAAMDINMMLNVIGRFDHAGIVALGDRIVDLHNHAKQMRITSPAGTDLTFSCEGRLCEQSGTYAAPGTSVMLSGQTSICAVEESINGIIVYDGGLFPPQEIGKQVNPVKLIVKNGVVIDIVDDCREAHLFKLWMAHWNDPKMYWIAHISCGFNPGIPEPTGRIEEDERVFGCVEIGIGTQGFDMGGPGWLAASHTDGIILNPSIYCDGVPFEENGFYVDPQCVELCRKLGVSGY